MIDIHLHILPGLDDGARDMDEAVRMCRMARDDGETVLVATPHMLDGLYDVTPEAAREGLAALRARLAEECVDIRLEVGGDVHVATDIPRLVQEGKALTVADKGSHIMLELPQHVVPTGLSDCLFGAQLAGITPIVSHPERNFAVQEDPDALLPLLEAGNLVQITARSLTGGFGREARECSLELVERGLAHVVASDAHSSTRRRPGLSRAREVVADLVGEEEAAAMFVERPCRIVEGGRVEPPHPKRRRRRRWVFWGA